MIKINVSGLNVQIDNKYSYLENLCKDYFCDFEVADIEVSASDDEIRNNRAISKRDFSDGYFESVCVYRKICKLLPLHNRLMLHSSVVKSSGNTVAFTGDSGAGKTTHTKFLLDNFGESLKVVNGDKPIIHIEKNKILAYGTPWRGEEGFGENTSAELSIICFIEKAYENRIEKVDNSKIVSLLLEQFITPSLPKALSKHLELVDILARKCEFYKLYCKADNSAAILSYNTFFKRRNNL